MSHLTSLNHFHIIQQYVYSCMSVLDWMVQH